MNPPKRPLGVTLTAVASILGSLVILLLAAFMLLASLLAKNQPGMPSHMGTFIVIEALVLAIVAAWGICTAVGLFKLRGWARWSTIAFSALLLVCCAPAAIVMAFVPLPQTPGAPPGMMTIVKTAIICFYALLALLGGIWLWYFNTAPVRGQFGGGIPAEGSRPLSISIIAWVMIVGSAGCLVGVIFAWPAMLFNLVIQGGASRALFLIFGIWELWAGLGLLRLRRRIAAIAFFALAALNSMSSALLPNFAGRMRFAMHSFPAWWPGMDQVDAAMPTMQPAMFIGGLMTLVPIWFLIARRAAFRSEAR